jgi:hypothetical protein
VNDQIPRGSLLNKPGFEKGSLIGGQKNPIIRPSGVSADSNQLNIENRVAWYKGRELDQRRAYEACMAQEKKKSQPNKYNCQFLLNIANDYARKAAAAGQQFDTTHSSQALRVQVPAPPPTQVGQPLPKMPSYINGRR